MTIRHQYSHCTQTPSIQILGIQTPFSQATKFSAIDLLLACFKQLIFITGLILSSHSTAENIGSSKQLNSNNIQLASVHATVLDLENGSILYAKNADTSVPIASITKLMTAMVVLDSGAPLNEYITIRKGDFDYHKNAYSRIRINSRLKRSDLLRLALMSSENLAATVLAMEHPGGANAFIKAMNDKAKTLGMKNTHFVDPCGLSPKNKSTAADLSKLLAKSLEYDKIKEYSTTRNYTATFKSPRYKLGYGNTNPLVHRRNWDILVSKTGYLKEAGRCLALLAEIDNKPVAMVFLDSFGKRSPLGDASRVKRWLTTGKSGTVAGAALKYERKKTSSL